MPTTTSSVIGAAGAAPPTARGNPAAGVAEIPPVAPPSDRPAAVALDEERFRDLLDLVSDWIWETGAGGACTFASPQVARCLGFGPGEIVGRTFADFMEVDDARRVAAMYARCCARRSRFRDAECRCLSKDGEPVILEVSGTPRLGPGGQLLGFRGVGRDVTARRRLEADKDALLAAAVERADRDPLTGLLNRHAFYGRLEEQVAAAGAGGPSLAVVLVDLDNFKYFNDAYGHLAGDVVLKQVATALRSCCRSGDALARLGGDEFAVLLPGLDADRAEERAAVFKERVAQTGFRPAGQRTSLPLQISTGVAIVPVDGATTADAGVAAGERMYHDKLQSRDFWSGFMREELTERFAGFSMLDALVTAVDSKDRYTRRHSEGVLFYGALIGAEIGLSENGLESLKIAALLHDVGKIGVPDRILRLPGKLTVAEFAAIKQHPALGAAIVGAVPELRHTLPAVRHHHEAWDGSGYPDGLAREQIPLMARILAVADAFAAMTTDRPYRRQLSPDEALARLTGGAGTQWDAGCVEAFLRAYRGASRP
jgi:diguanylate cyclase (GGDEF)-like protein/PAS domain S-box-containing protein